MLRNKHENLGHATSRSKRLLRALSADSNTIIVLLVSLVIQVAVEAALTKVENIVSPLRT